MEIDDVTSPPRPRRADMSDVDVRGVGLQGTSWVNEARFRAFADASGAVFYQLSADWSELQPLDGKGLVPSNDPPVSGWFERNVASTDHKAVRERIAHCIATRSRFDMEHRTNRPDGTIGWARSRAVPVLDEAGKILEWVGTAEDVTERKTAEEQLQRSHDTFYNLIQNNPFGVYVVDTDFKLRQVSAGAQNVFAQVPRPLLGRDFGEVLRSVWAEPFASQAIGLFRHTLDTGEPYVAARTVERRHDVEATEAYDWRIERITLPDGRFGVVCYFYDLSERQRWEAALRQSEQRFRLMADAVPQIVWITDAEGRAQFFNQQWSKYTGIDYLLATADEVAATVVHPDDGPATMAAFNEARRTGGTFSVEHRIRSASGEYRWFLVRGEPYRDPETGQIIQWFGASVDIHDRKLVESERQALLDGERAARSEAERAGRLKDEFLATLSHELRTPLNAILGWSQILGRDKNMPDDVADGLRTIERNARAQAQIIEDLLDMSRIIGGKVRLDVQRVDLASLLREAVETTRPTADAKGVELTAVLDPLAGHVIGDPNRLQQVFWNLLTNAIKFTPHRGGVRVVLRRGDAHVEASVIDTGQGIGPEFLPHVFDRFRQADASTTRRHGGLGLGLSIAKQLVELHGGSIRARSAGSGKGAEFTVSLPLAAISPGRHSEPDRQFTSPGVHTASSLLDHYPKIAGVKVLVVDDEPDARALVKRLLEDRQAIVCTAGSASEALLTLEAERPDVLVSDIGMPGENGYSLMRSVRALDPSRGGNVPAVALTAYARAEDRVRALLAGFQVHVSKPVKPVELMTVIASLVP